MVIGEAILLMGIGGYFITGYWWLLMDIILVVIGGYFINDYWWLNYHTLLLCLLVAILLVAIVSYYIIGH
jgi:hypothetical protein